MNVVLLIKSAVDIFHIIFIGSIVLSIYKKYHYNNEKNSKKNT